MPPAVLTQRRPLAGGCVQVLLRRRAEPIWLGDLMPTHWADYIRNTPSDQLRPFGGPNPMPAKGMWY